MFHKSIKSLLHKINIENEASKKAVNLFSDKGKVYSVISLIKNTLEQKYPFDVDGTDIDRKGMWHGHEYDETDVTDIDITSCYLKTIDDIVEENGKARKIFLTVLCKANASADCYYIDEANSIWDSEAREYWEMQKGQLRETHSFEFECSISAFINDQGVEKIEINDIDKIILNQYTRTSQEKVCDYDETIHRTYICPYCNKGIKIKLFDYMNHVSTDERQMGAEEQYSVNEADDCSHCNGHYKLSGTLCFYPLGMLNYDDVKIEKAKKASKQSKH